MSFYTPAFALFFAVTAALYFLVPAKYRVPILLAASIFFYGSFVLWYIVPLFVLITVDFLAGLRLERSENPGVRKAWLIVSLAMNLGFMASFKYIPDVVGSSIAIPIGLSFHTFQSMGYMIEVYRRRQAAERSYMVFALYVLFFPQIAAGPIEKPQNLLHQFREEHKFNYHDAVAGFQLIAWGLFQKYVIAANLGAIVDAVYRDPASKSGPAVVFSSACFAFQILCDFSGYSDLALGLAQMMGFRLTRNFNRPFHADTMAEYWKRWHISLSIWMRDYVFFPLCGSRPGIPRICFTIMVVFLANGIWHGARWNYLASGFLHGSYRVTELLSSRFYSRRGWSAPPFLQSALKMGRTLLVFSLMSFAFIFFRGDSLSQSLDVISRLPHGWVPITAPGGLVSQFARDNLGPMMLLRAVMLIGVVQLVNALQALGPIRIRLSAQPAWLRWSFYYAGVATLVALAPHKSASFIYFRF